MRIISAAVFLSSLCSPCLRGESPGLRGESPAVAVNLNGLEIVLDAKTGGVLRLAHAGPGTILDAAPDAAGICELAVGVDKAAVPRLAPRFSSQAKLTKSADRVIVRWDRLGGDKPAPALTGSVAVTATFQAAPDGRSVAIQCAVENRSGKPVTQVLFPDLVGLLPTAGPEQTEFRSGGIGVKPFASLTPSAPDPFVGNPAVAAYTAAGLYSPMIIRWLDLGGLRGGLSLFERTWGLQPPMTVLVQLRTNDKKLRLAVAHSASIPSGATWQSPVYWLTPHEAGWAKGIEPYRAWVRQNMNRVVSQPSHVRDGLGFRTVWLSRSYPDDPQDANWTFADLVKLAAESKEHGLDEMVLWGCHEYFLLPLPAFHKHLGGDEGLVRAVAECKKLGVNVAPFISVCNAREKTAARYGVKVGQDGWTYHPEFIPRFNPPYAGQYRCAQISTRHPVWRQEVLDSCKRLVDMGIPSLSWDQYFIEPPEPNVLTLTREIRGHSRRRDPQSTFSAEELNAVEVSCDYLDFTWNWGMMRPCEPVTSVFPTPRVNLNVDTSAEEVKYAFATNRYVNVQPRKPDGANGTDWIASHRELSAALKQCAKLRRQFLAYFVEGTLVAECILREPCPDAVVAGYVLPDKALVVVVNRGAKREIALRCDPRPWLKGVSRLREGEAPAEPSKNTGPATSSAARQEPRPPGVAQGRAASPSGKYEVRCYDGGGKPVRTLELSAADGRLATPLLGPLDVALFEILPR